MLKKDSVLFGIIIGLVIPFVAYALIMEINDLIVNKKLISLGEDRYFEGFTDALKALTALCFNVIPFQYFTRRYLDDAMRGMVIVTVVLVVAWVVYFDKLPI